MKKKNKPSYGMGGFGDFLQTVSPLLGLIPGAGAVAAPLAGIAGGMISQANANKNQPYAGPPVQQNTNPYGMQHGGTLDPGDPPKVKFDWKSGKITTENNSEPSAVRIASPSPNPNKTQIRAGSTSKSPYKNPGTAPVKKINRLNPGYKDSAIENIAEILDPTGGLSYDDVVRTWKNGKFTYEDITEPLGALPLVGKFKNIFKGLSGYEKNLTTLGKLRAGQKVLNIEDGVEDIYQDNIKADKASGGYLNQAGPNTQEVIGNNPAQTDGVELPQAYVDHGETISNTSQGTYVFSDILKNPLTGNSFAEDDKKLATSDKKASAKPYDKEAQNTLMMNKKLRDQLTVVNDITRGLSDLSKMAKIGMAKGGYIKPSYQNGGPPKYLPGYVAPWEGFNIAEFQTAAGLTPDNAYGPKTHEALMGDLGRKYAISKGNIWDETTSSFLPQGGKSNMPLDITTLGGVESGLDLMRRISSDNNTIPQVPNIYQVGQKPVGDPSVRKNISSIPDSFYQVEGTPGDATYIPVDNSPTGLGTPVTLRNEGSAGVSATGDPLTTKPITERRSNNGIGSFLGKNAGTILQGLGFAAQAATIAKRPDKQNLYLNSAPINKEYYDPAQALNRNQYSFNALRSDIGNSVGDASRMSNLQQAYANQSMNQAQIVNQYDQMNRQAGVNYEQRLGQRQAENNQSRYAVDQINDQNLAARNNAARGLFANLAGLGSEINNQKTNKQSVNWLLQAYPDIAKFFEQQNKPKTKKGGRYG